MWGLFWIPDFSSFCVFILKIVTHLEGEMKLVKEIVRFEVSIERKKSFSKF